MQTGAMQTGATQTGAMRAGAMRTDSTPLRSTAPRGLDAGLAARGQLGDELALAAHDRRLAGGYIRHRRTTAPPATLRACSPRARRRPARTAGCCASAPCLLRFAAASSTGPRPPAVELTIDRQPRAALLAVGEMPIGARVQPDDRRERGVVATRVARFELRGCVRPAALALEQGDPVRAPARIGSRARVAGLRRRAGRMPLLVGGVDARLQISLATGQARPPARLAREHGCVLLVAQPRKPFAVGVGRGAASRRAGARAALVRECPLDQRVDRRTATADGAIAGPCATCTAIRTGTGTGLAAGTPARRDAGSPCRGPNRADAPAPSANPSHPHRQAPAARRRRLRAQPGLRRLAARNPCRRRRALPAAGAHAS